MSDDSFTENEEVTENENASDLPMLTFEEARVLGCLLEKEMSTPEHYPLTLNQLHSACNQKSSREPVVDFGTDTVEEAMEALRYKKLSLLVHQAGARVPKNKHTLENEFVYLDKAERALLCVLLLRGQQTLGELRQRTERMHSFPDLDRAQKSLDKLINYEQEPLVKMIPAGGGRRVVTYVHLLSGDVSPAHAEDVISSLVAPVQATTVSSASWREEMETAMAEMRSEISVLETELSGVKAELSAIKAELGI
ncbi:MAG: YceH family protein [Verrucomicrobiales bacterium]